ncbi:MAG: hypothetical protein BWY96_03181 [Spirochaetes bacterium ADurb.BinA120]|nr:MAG: hypothetical protein BWY96_03181 [Spirochaetes bacterium ADurb.BinA120]
MRVRAVQKIKVWTQHHVRRAGEMLTPRFKFGEIFACFRAPPPLEVDALWALEFVALLDAVKIPIDMWHVMRRDTGIVRLLVFEYEIDVVEE